MHNCVVEIMYVKRTNVQMNISEITEKCMKTNNLILERMERNWNVYIKHMIK